MGMQMENLSAGLDRRSSRRRQLEWRLRQLWVDARPIESDFQQRYLDVCHGFCPRSCYGFFTPDVGSE